MKPTEQEIANAAVSYISTINNPTIGTVNTIHEAFKACTQWAISQMQPEWVACKYQDEIPNGWYSFLLKSGGIEKEDFVYVINGKVPYYFATHYCKIELPQPPKDINQ